MHVLSSPWRCAHPYMCVHARTCVSARVQACACAHACTRTHTQTHMRTCSCAPCEHMHVHACAYARTCARARVRTHAHLGVEPKLCFLDFLVLALPDIAPSNEGPKGCPAVEPLMPTQHWQSPRVHAGARDKQTRRGTRPLSLTRVAAVARLRSCSACCLACLSASCFACPIQGIQAVADAVMQEHMTQLTRIACSWHGR